MYDDRLNYDRGYFYSDPEKAGIDALRDAGYNVPIKMEVCDRCNGRGTRALHGMVLSDESLEDREFMEDYMAGRYDTVCDDCKGRNVQEVVDLARLTKTQRKIYHAAVRETRQSNAESLAELRMGA